jgi:single-strand DNA-binding protein
VPEAPSSPTINLAVLRGTASAAPELRQLPSGRRLATFAVRTHGLEPPATSVPVAVWDPPAWIETIEVGDELVVAGCIRRRFFRAASGGLGSRVELEASVVGRAGDSRQRRKVRLLGEEGLESLE